MRRQRFVFVMSVLFALITVMGIGCKNQFLEKPTFGSPDTSNSEQTTGSAVSFGAPSGLKATQGGYREITLSWNPVTDAVRYYVYRANTQFDTFVQVGETGDAATSYTMKVQSGADFYYRVTAVNYGGKESGFSAIVRGTALAQPLVSGIEGVEGKEDSDVTVYWYMGNVDAYQNMVRYNVICYDSKGTELARTVVDGSKLTETAAVIKDLVPNTTYTYAVEAYLVSAQDKVEKCEPIDAVTARRLRPNAPEELVVQQGQSKDGIILSFKLPALVDVALPGGLYEQKPLFFKIYRREYEEGVEESQKTKKFELVTGDFGKTVEAKDGETQLVKFNSTDEEYTPGNIVTWTDTDKNLDRGVMYEYKVQAFAYVANRDISSDMSVATNHGWLIAKATFGTDEYSTVKDNADKPTKNVAATLKFAFEFDTMGVNYHYILAEEHWSLESDGEDNKSVLKSTTPNLIPFTSVNDINTYERKFDISEETRGYYKYKLYIMTEGQHELSEATLEVIAVGQVLVTDSLSLPVIKLFSVENTADNEIKLSWDFNKDYKYAIKYSEDGGEEVDILNEYATSTVGTLDREHPNGDGSISFIDNPGEGKTRVYTLYALKDVTVSSLPITASTFATPKPKQTNYAYNAISVQWEDVVADSFTINATYQDETVARKYPIESGTYTKRHATELSQESLVYTFKEPNGYDKYTVSGLPVKITVQAHVTPKKITHTLRGTEGSSYQVTTTNLDPITLVDNQEFLSHTMGPANVNAVASQGTNQDNITLTWNKVEGATAYAIIRNRMHIDSSSKKVFQSTDTYVVNASGETPTVSLASSSEDISGSVTITASTSAENPTYTLTDSVITELSEGASKWQTSQSQISWGAPYEYTVLPLLTVGAEITYDYESSKTHLTLAEVPLSEVAFKDGGTTGYGWNVVASKGDYTSGDSNENTAVKIMWTKPWFAKENAIYTVYRREENTSTWEVVSNNVQAAQQNQYINTSTGEKSARPGVVYEYAVGITNEGHPGQNSAYNKFTSEIKDEFYETEKAAIGFVLPQPTINSVSRDAKHGTDKEQLVWGASQVGKQANRMFEGYIVEVMNNNIDTSWHEIARFTFGAGFEKASQYEQYIYNKNDLLKVLRDYKHYFRIRTFTNGGDVVSKAPDYTWSDGNQNEYVKWGARQLTPAEYNKCVTLVLAYGLRLVNSTEWNTGYFGRDKDATSPGSGTMHAESDFWVTDWNIIYSNYRQGYTTKSGRILPSFLTVNGTLEPKTSVSNQYPKSYSTSNGITVTGPSEVNGMYNGTITFSSSSGNSSVNFTGGSGSFSYSKDSSYSPLPMDGGDYKVDSEEWK